MPRVTLREIAERVGCTRSTVSYALRNLACISPETRARVQAAARQLGWQPDARLQRQMALIRSTTARTDLPNLGVIMKRTRKSLADLPTIRRHLEGVTERARELGFAANVFNLEYEPIRPRRLASIMHARGIQGIVLLDFDLSIPREYWDLAGEFAAVSVGVDPEHPAVNVAFSDYLSIGRRAVHELIRLGYRRPGFITPMGTEKLLHFGFTGGFCAGVAALPASHRLDVLYVGDEEIYIPPERYAGEIRAWVARHRPDVLLTIDTWGVTESIKGSASAHLPVYSVDWHPGDPGAGGIDQRPDAIGRAAVNLVVAQLDRGEVGAPSLKLTVLVDEEWSVSEAVTERVPARVARRS